MPLLSYWAGQTMPLRHCGGIKTKPSMLRYTLLVLAVCFIAITTGTAQTDADKIFTPGAIKAAMVKVAAWQISEFEQGRILYPKDEWQNGALYTGLIALDKMSTDKKYYKFLYGIGEDNHWQTAANRLFADDYCVGQMYSQMYSRYKETK